MTGWSEILTVALLGTARRPPPAEPPAWAGPIGSADDGSAEGRVLDLAAAHRVAAHAGRRALVATGAGGPAAAPPQRLAFGPRAATELLTIFLGRPDVTAINLWLAACGRFGFGVAPENWAPLVALANRSTTYDRTLLALSLGERGRWFVHQNPDWRRLADTLDRLSARPDDRLGAHRPARPSAEQVQADPELLLTVPPPWPDRLVGAAYSGLVAGRMGGRARSYARSLGSRLSLAQYAALGASARDIGELPQLTPAARRGVRNLFVEIERAGFERFEIDRAFDPSVERIFRVTIPPV